MLKKVRTKSNASLGTQNHLAMYTSNNTQALELSIDITEASRPSGTVAKAEQPSSASRSTSTIYESTPLPAKSKKIRVLRITADLKCPSNDCLHGNMRVVNLEEKPDFAALSYVWGTFGTTRKIIHFGSVRMELTDNCWSALWHLVKQLGPFTVWVDAICINQDDENEKVAQLSLMKDIYSAARPTYIWLGDGTALSDNAMNYLAVAGLQQYFSRTIVRDPDSGRFFLPVERRRLFRLAFEAYKRTFLAIFDVSLPQTCG